MFIKSVGVTGLIGLKTSSDIKTLNAEFNSSIQIFLGPNGSGKSSLLRECVVDTSSRGNYVKEGEAVKILEIDHKGSIYHLKVDFSRKDKPYSFLKDGEELNDSGTTTVQEELIEEHLGYTSAIRDISTHKNKLCSMTASTRNAWLTSINPYNLNDVYATHRAVLSRIKMCKNNLTMLYERKALRESEIIEESVIENLIKEKEGLVKDMDILTECKFRLQEKLSSSKVNSDHKDYFSDTKFKSIQDSVLKIRKRSVSWSHSYKNNLKEELERSLNELTLLIEVCSKRLQELAQDINNLEDHLEKIKRKEVKDTLDEDIKALEANLSKLRKLKTDKPIPHYSLESSEEVLDTIKSLIEPFIGHNHDVMHPHDIKNRKNKIDYYTQVRNRIERSLLDYQNKLLDLKTPNTDLNIPIDKCQEYSCPLYLEYKKNHDKYLTERSSTVIKIKSLSSRITRIDKYLDDAKTWVQYYLPYASYFIKLHKYLEDKSYLNKDVLFDVLKSNPNKIYQNAIVVYESSKAFYDYELDSKKLLSLLEKKKMLSEVSLKQKEVIIDQLTKVTNDHKLEHQKYKGYTNKKTIIEQQMKSYLEYEKSVEWLTATKETVIHHLNESIKDYSFRIIQIMLTEVTEAQSKCITRLGEIDRVVRQQDILKATYGSEILERIKVLEDEKDKYIEIEKALGPSGIPLKYTVNFLNNVVRKTNYLISLFFNKRMELQELKPEDQITFEFKAIVQDEEVPKISLCSDGEKETIDWCFNAALMWHLGLKEYPLYADELGKTFDHTNKQQVLNAIHFLINENKISQLFLINHHSVIHEGLSNGEFLVLKEDNILLPESYNDHVVISR